MQIIERLRGSVRFMRGGVYRSCPNRMSNVIDRSINASENDGTTNQSQPTVVAAEEINNNRPLASATAATRNIHQDHPIDLPPLPIVPENEKSIVCCCLSSQTALHLLLISYWLWSLGSFVYSVNTVFPALYLFPIIAMLLAFIGSSIAVYQLLIPFMFITAWDMLYATICAILLVSFHNNDRHIILNKFVYDYWREKAKEFDEMNQENFELYLTMFLFKTFYAMAAFIITGQEITRLRVHLFFERRRQDIIRQRELINSREESRLQNFLNEAMQTNQSQDPYAQLFSQVPPPPSYQTFSHPVLRTPQMGTPPPTYSMIEREGRLQPLPINWSPASQQSNMNQSDGQHTSSSYKISDESTAMSPSSFMHSPPSSKYSSN